MRDMSPVKQEYGSRGVDFLAVNVFDSPEAARAFIRRSGFDFVWLRAEQSATEALGLRVVPLALVLDRDGRVVWRSRLLSRTPPAQAIRDQLARLTSSRVP